MMLNNIIIATTNHECDNSIVQFCIDHNIDYYREVKIMSLTDTIKQQNYIKLRILFRITSDCPLMDSQVVDEMIDYFIKTNLNFEMLVFW